MMMKVLFSILIIYILLFLLLCVNYYLFSFQEKKWKFSSLEAGFISSGKIHKTFSLQFFFLMIIFIIFDLEILMIFSFIIKKNFFVFMNFFVLIFFFLTLLIEWKWSKLVWMK